MKGLIPQPYTCKANCAIPCTTPYVLIGADIGQNRVLQSDLPSYLGHFA